MPFLNRRDPDDQTKFQNPLRSVWWGWDKCTTMGVFWVIPLKHGLSVMMSGCQLQGFDDP